MLRVSELLDTVPDQAVEQLESCWNSKETAAGTAAVSAQSRGGPRAELIKQAEVVNGVNVVIAEVNLTEAEQMRSLGDDLRDPPESRGGVSGFRASGKVQLVAMASKRSPEAECMLAM